MSDELDEGPEHDAPAASWTVDPIYGCWIAERVDEDGYAITWRGARPVKTYLLTWTEAHGPVPPGMVLDHRCRRRACVRPSHLEPVSQHVNLLRRRWSVRAREAKCKAGHDMKLHAMITPEGGRLCRLCDR